MRYATFHLWNILLAMVLFFRLNKVEKRISTGNRREATPFFAYKIVKYDNQFIDDYVLTSKWHLKKLDFYSFYLSLNTTFVYGDFFKVIKISDK